MARHRFSHLETPRLSLVPPAEVAAEALAAAVGDFEVSRWLTRVPHPYSREDAAAFQEHAAANEGRVWTALDPDGIAGGVSIDPDLGYWVARRAWSRGYATEMAVAVIDAWFSDPDAGPLFSGHFEGNAASARVLDRLGFRAEGTVTQHPLSLGREVVVRRMSLARSDWSAARLRVAPN